MSEMIWQPRFGELEAEREVVLEEIAMYEDDPQDRVFDVLGKAIFGSHPLGRAVIGTAEVVGAVTREQLAAFHAERYRPDSIVIAAAGLGRSRRARGDGRRTLARRRRARRWSGRQRACLGDRGASAAQLRPRTCPTSRRARTSCRKTPSSTTCASAAPGSRATTSAASRCACSKACSAAPPPRGSSRRCASAAGSPTRSSPSPTSTPTRARSVCTWARARTTSERRSRSSPPSSSAASREPGPARRSSCARARTSRAASCSAWSPPERA